MTAQIVTRLVEACMRAGSEFTEAMSRQPAAAPDPTMARIDCLVEGYRAALMKAHGLVGRMECEGPDAAESIDLSPAAGAGPGGNPAGVSVPPGLPPAGAPDPSRATRHTVPGAARGEGPAADSGIRQPPAAGHPPTESGLDMGGRYAAELFPQHTRHQR